MTRTGPSTGRHVLSVAGTVVLAVATLTAVLDLDADPAIATAVFDGVGDQVLHRRSESGGVAQDRRRILDEIALDRHRLRFEQGDRALYRAFDHVGWNQRQSRP